MITLEAFINKKNIKQAVKANELSMDYNDINFIDPLPRIKQKKWELMESGTDWTYDDFCSNMKNNYGYANF